MLLSNSQFIPPSIFPFGNQKFVFYVCEFLFYKYIVYICIIYFISSNEMEGLCKPFLFPVKYIYLCSSQY